MATRRDAREWAVQILFQFDMNPPEDTTAAMEAFWCEHPKTGDRNARAFAEETIRGICEHREEIDALIRKYAEHWDIRRMATVDRNVMRIALYEMLHRDDVPAAVSINEAVDLAKYFNSTESGRFVNGILDRARKELGQPGKQ